MGAKMLQIKKKEEVKEEIIEETEKEPIFENQESNIEAIIEPVEEPVSLRDVEETKTKRSRRMTPAAKEQLDNARLKSIERRKENARKKKEKEENEYREKYSKEYQDEISLLKQQLEEMRNIPKQEKVIEKVIYKEKEVQEKPKQNPVDNYRFNLEDLEFYSNEKIKQYELMKDKVKKNKRQDVMNRFYYNLR